MTASGLRHVALVTDELEIGGSQRQILELGKGLLARGIAASVVYFRPEKSAMVGDLRAAGLEPIAVAKRRRVDPLFSVQLYRTLRRLRPDVVQTYGATADLWARSAAILARTPVVIASARDSRVVWELRRLLKPLDRATTAFLANSQAVRTALHEARGVSLERIGVIYNGIRVRPPATRQRPLGGTCVIGTACRQVPQKNLSCLMQAAARLQETGASFQVELAGEGPLQPALREEAERLGISRVVTFLGPRKDVPALMANWDIAVLPSWFEGLSNFLMEAMQAGLPIVASDIPENRELLADGRAGLLFPPDRPDELAKALLGLMEDRERARALGDQAGREIQAYSVESMVEQHVALYERCLQDMPRR